MQFAGQEHPSRLPAVDLGADISAVDRASFGGARAPAELGTTDHDVGSAGVTSESVHATDIPLVVMIDEPDVFAPGVPQSTIPTECDSQAFGIAEQEHIDVAVEHGECLTGAVCRSVVDHDDVEPRSRGKGSNASHQRLCLICPVLHRQNDRRRRWSGRERPLLPGLWEALGNSRGFGVHWSIEPREKRGGAGRRGPGGQWSTIRAGRGDLFGGIRTVGR